MSNARGPGGSPRFVVPALWIVGVLLFAAVLGARADEAWDRSFDILPPATQRAREYLNLRYSLFVGGTLWRVIGLGLLVMWRVGPRLAEGRLLRRAKPVLAATLMAGAALTFLALWHLPVSAISYAIEKRYGFSTASPGLWLADRVRDWAFSLLWAPLAGLAMAVVRRFPRGWWAVMGAALVPVAFVVLILYPVIIEPAYNRFESMQPGTLRNRIADLAERAGAKDPAILVVDASRRTTRMNAYVVGLGPTHRIVLWDTLLKGMSEEEILAVTAHELGHYVLKHIWWGFLLESMGGFVILWLLARSLIWSVRHLGERLGVQSLTDPAIVPVAYCLLGLLLMVQTPIASAISRQMERQADAFGLRLYPNGLAAARSFAAFGTRDYADPDPPRWAVLWFYSHPPLRERVAAALHADAEGAAHEGRRKLPQEGTLTGVRRLAERRAAAVN